MADEQKPTMSSPLNTVMFNVPQVDIKKINPQDLSTDPELREEYKRALEARDRYTQELEDRYRQPNWFKVAAGFAKPQLGGFLASIGSASNALGDWQEQARAIAPTVAQMRAETAMGQIALKQGLKAAGITQKAISENRVPTGVEAGHAAGLVGGPSAVAKTGQEIQTAQIGDFIRALQENRNYADLVAQFGKGFVDSTLPAMLTSIPGIKPPVGYPGANVVSPTPNAPGVSATTNATPVAGGPAIQGAPSADELPRSAQVATQKLQTEEKVAATRKLNDQLSDQAHQGAGLYEAASSVYKAAAKPSLMKAFGAFEQGDVMGAIGRALEKQTVSEVIGDMRQQIINARLGDTEKTRALSDLQALEGALASMQYQMQQGVINPTDLRTTYEAKSLPGVKNTQDAFLRGIARLGSEGLARYELNQAFQQAKNNPKFDVYDWNNSDYYRNVMNNAKKRTSALISNPASYTPPEFLTRGLTQTKPTNVQEATSSPFREEAKRRGLQ